MRTTFPSSILLICGALVSGVLGFLFFWKPSPNIPVNTAALRGTFADPRLHLDLTRSTPDHPVYVSDTYGFEYAPTGTFTESIGTLTGTEVFAADINPSTGASGISLHIYRNDAGIDGTVIEAFRAWRTSELYSDTNDTISHVTINGLPFLRATQADGIDHQSDYYYLIQPSFVYVFIFPNQTEMGPITSSLSPFRITAINSKIPTQLESTIILDDLNEAHISGPQATALISQIEALDQYSTGSPEPSIGGMDCGTGRHHDQLLALNSGDKRSLKLNDGLLITATPNTFGWTAADVRAFDEDATVVCGASTTVPHLIVGNWVLWWSQCVGGVQPDPSLPSYKQTVRCLQAQEVLEQHYSL